MQELGDLGRVPTDEPLSREVLRAVLGVQVEEVQPDAVLPLPQDVVLVAFWGQLYKIRSSRKIDSRRLFSREKDFTKTFALTENQLSGKTYFYTIRPWEVCLG